jgi:phage recombination protein Bet
MATSLAQLTDADFSREKIELIKRTIAVGATDDELQLFLYTCKRTGLDPLARQIYSIKRGGKMTIQTGIDGYRVIADRTGRLAGISDYTFDSEDGQHPNKATVTVKKVVGHVAEAEFTATARWSEYNAGGPMWTKMPYLMLGKCAEALALRKAFPADLSGVYTAEEMAQADNAEQGAAVFAEVEKQKAAHKPVSYPTLDISEAVVIPPELDWSYNRSSGVLICRIMDAKKTKKKKGEGEFLTLLLNNELDKGKKPTVYYFHATHAAALLGAVGKVVKVVIEQKGDFFNVETVLEIDGVKTIEPPTDEFQARALASTMDFEEEDIRELHSRCKGSWPTVLAKLNEEKTRREAEADSNDVQLRREELAK